MFYDTLCNEAAPKWHRYFYTVAIVLVSVNVLTRCISILARINGSRFYLEVAFITHFFTCGICHQSPLCITQFDQPWDSWSTASCRFLAIVVSYVYNSYYILLYGLCNRLSLELLLLYLFSMLRACYLILNRFSGHSLFISTTCQSQAILYTMVLKQYYRLWFSIVTQSTHFKAHIPTSHLDCWLVFNSSTFSRSSLIDNVGTFLWKSSSN